ncbi:phage portal protein [Cryobacterium cryoconiti]|uniref:Phage portal protein n=1 Tax=Cryobacterium cryoconiti TaxID=1259239 RepID=A0A4Y8JRH7_9MICO|nr:phage portal protein [Cryobacterium cryoconiti]TFD27512.1 phage portal protein [Cryobacterium cryoconiti]
MPIDTKTPMSPGWWMRKAVRKLELRQPRLAKLAAYHDGNPPLPVGAEQAREAYQAFQKKARTNFAELIVGAVRERCSVRSIRTAVDKDGNGDDLAWSIWRDNDLDIEFSDVLENMLALGDAYMMIGEDEDDPTKVVITGEDPRQVVTIHDPVRQSIVRCAIKMFHDPDEEKDFIYLFIYGQDGDNARRYVASRPRKRAFSKQSFSAAAYEWEDADGGADGEELKHELVPVVRFRNRRGIGEFEPHIDILDRINHTLLQRMVIATYQAFKQRALLVDPEDMPDEDEDGQPIDYADILTADPGAWLKIPATAKIWESTQADLQGILSSVKDDVQHLAAVTRTPLSVISPDAVNQSAEGAALIKEGQIFKTEDKQKRAASSLVLVYVIAFLTLGETARAVKKDIVIDWAPAERYSLQQKYDAASKAPSGGVPKETIWSHILQFSPEQIGLMKNQVTDDAIAGVLSGSTPSAAAQPNAG